MLPHSEACVRNQAAILAQLDTLFIAPSHLLEIGSGTGQHAVYFGAHLPHLVWHTSDLPAYHAGIRAWLDHAVLPNVLPPLLLDVETATWGSADFDGVFSANTLHIMGWPQVQAFFAGVERVLKAGGKLVVYGPFNYNEQFTSDSNRQFDQSLRQRDAASGIRDFAAVDALAQQHGLTLLADHAMPANNRLLVWQRDN